MSIITISKSKVEKNKGMVVLSLADYEAMKEELAILRSKKLAKDIKRAREEINRDSVIGFIEAKRRLKIA